MKQKEHSSSTYLFKYTPFEKHSILHLVLFLASCYIILHMVLIVLMILADNPVSVYETSVLPNIGIKDWLHFIKKPWVVLTYSLAQKSFFALMTNLLWLFVFGSIIQQKISNREIMVMFFAVYILNAVLYLLFTSFFMGASFSYVFNTMPAVVSFAFASLALNPRERVDVKISADIPFWIFVAVFCVLLLTSVQGVFSIVGALYIIAAIVGWLYGSLLKFGKRPGHIVMNKLEQWQAVIGGKDEHIDGWDVSKIEESLRTNRSDLPEEVIVSIVEKLKRGGMGALSMSERGILINSK